MIEYKLEDYKIMGRIGEGAHGIVLKAKNRKTGTFVALKRMLNNKDDKISVSVLREVKSLQYVNSKYVVKLLGVLTTGPSLVLVLELMAGGVGNILQDVDNPVSVQQYKAYSRMLLSGLQHLHQLSIMHRDLKPSNLLIGYDGILRIADLGQARIAKGRPFSHQVGSRWYRAPELLYGSRDYTLAVDLWSVGCIIAEMINGSPLFPIISNWGLLKQGESDIEQLAIVIKSLGSPSQDSWPALKSLPDYEKISFPKSRGKSWKNLLPDSPPGAISLIKSLVTYNPEHRLTAEQALKHPFFETDPLPLRDEEVSLPPALRKNKKNISYGNDESELDQPYTNMFADLKRMFSLSDNI